MTNWFSGFETHVPNPVPHPALQHLLITFRPDEYLDKQKRWRQYEPPKDYIENLPLYIMARCPFCNAEYRALLDTHSLLASYGDDMGGCIWREKFETRGCKHFLAIHPFVNLNGFFPEERKKYFHSWYDVPFISPLFLPDEVRSYAVMHSLPICHIEDGHFVPRYYLYTLTYYVPDDYVAWEYSHQSFRRGTIVESRGLETKTNKLHWEGFLYYPIEARKHPEWWDLPLWVKKGKLLWLDPHSPNLELRNGPIEDFPYANIQGYRRGVEIRNGKFRFLD